MPKARPITAEILAGISSAFYVCPLTGLMYHRINKYGLNGRKSIIRKPGDRAGSQVPCGAGYFTINYGPHVFKVHRIVWALANGPIENPDLEIDHINGIRTDNRLSNLRLVSRRTNSHNTHGPRCNSKSGHEGIYWYKAYSKWTAQIKVDGVNVFLGYFPADRIEDAIRARAEAKKRLHVGAQVIGV